MDEDKFKRLFLEVGKVYGVDPDSLFHVMLGCAVRGKADWTIEGVIQAIQMLQNGKGCGEIIEHFLISRSGFGLN
jgi:hypothetical protein